MLVHKQEDLSKLNDQKLQAEQKVSPPPSSTLMDQRSNRVHSSWNCRTPFSRARWPKSPSKGGGILSPRARLRTSHTASSTRVARWTSPSCFLPHTSQIMHVFPLICQIDASKISGSFLVQKRALLAYSRSAWGNSPNSFSPLSTFLTRLLREILSHCCRLALVSRTFQLYFFTYTTSPRIHAYVDEARYDAPFTSVTSLVHFCSRITQTPRNGVPKAYTWRKLRADAGTLIMEQKSGCE